MPFVFLIFRNDTRGRAARSSKMEVFKGLNGLSKTSNCKPNQTKKYTRGREARSSKMEVFKGLDGLSKTSNCKPSQTK